MDKLWTWIVKGLAALGGAVAGAFGGLDATLLVLGAMMAIDYATGVIVAWMGKSQKTQGGGLDSKAGFAGLLKKALILLVVLAAALLDQALGTGEAVFRSVVMWFYIANEGLSVLENLALAGVPFPEKLRRALEQLKQEE